MYARIELALILLMFLCPVLAAPLCTQLAYGATPLDCSRNKQEPTRQLKHRYMLLVAAAAEGGQPKDREHRSSSKQVGGKIITDGAEGQQGIMP